MCRIGFLYYSSGQWDFCFGGGGGGVVGAAKANAKCVGMT